MKFSEFATYLEKLEDTSSRTAITDILASLFKDTNPEEIDKITYLLLGELAPDYENINFNIADRTMIRIIARACDQPLEKVNALFKEKGDLGTIAQELSKGEDHGLIVSEVYDSLMQIAKVRGEDSQERKINETADLLSKLDPSSARYAVRILLGKLRLGFSEKTVLDALSWMEKGDKSAEAKLNAAYQVLPDVGLLAKEVKEIGIEAAVKNVSPQTGVPVLSMLAQRLKSPAEMIQKMGKVSVEPKYDGLRIQIHFERGKFVKAFTRNLKEISWMFPELNGVGNSVKGEQVILDSEAVGVDQEREAMVNFQSTMTRRRKHDIKGIAAKVSIKFHIFDILKKDDQNIMPLHYDERRKILRVTIIDGELFQMTESTETKDPNEISRLYTEYRQRGMEGIMIKRVNSAYVPGRTGWRWIKMKEAEGAIGKLADTVDCVVMGYSAGKGKRASFGVGQILVGIRDNDSYKTVTKVGTGLTDEQFKELNKRLLKLVVPEKPKEYKVNPSLKPDYWVTPSLVVEIAADDITQSPTHTAGLALRFPRLVRFRDDKSREEITSLNELKELYRLQEQ